MKKEGLRTKWMDIPTYDIFKTVLGLLVLGITLYIYVNYYYSFEGKENLGIVLTIMLMVGVVLLAQGMDSWRKRDAQIQRVEKMNRKVEYEKKKNELEGMKNPPSIQLVTSRKRK